MNDHRALITAHADNPHSEILPRKEHILRVADVFLDLDEGARRMPYLKHLIGRESRDERGSVLLDVLGEQNDEMALIFHKQAAILCWHTLPVFVTYLH